jgi:hypothetical protein
MPQKKKIKSVDAKKKTFKIIAIVIGVLLIFDLSPLGGTMKFYTTWVSCGHKPVVTVGSGYFNTGVSSYHFPPNFNLFPGGQDYFCSPFDAEKHGYSANPNEYDFPVLKKNNALCQRPTDPKSETAATFSPCK